MASPFLCSVLLFCFIFSSAALYSSNSAVVSLTKENFAGLVFPSDHLWLVEFYAPWCGHCKSLAPEWDKAASNLKNLVKVGAIDCDQEKELCGHYQIRGFPTIKVFPAKQVENPYQKGAPYKNAEDYQGARQAAAIVNYALALQPSFVASVSSKNFEDFETKNKDLAKALLFTNKDKTTTLYKGLSSEFKGRLALGEVKHTDSELVKKYGVTNFPTLLIVPKDATEAVKFDGKLQFDTISVFFNKYASTKKTASKPQKAEKPKEEEVIVTVPQVRDQETFNKTCTRLCAISFLSAENTGDEQHKNFLEIQLKVAKKNHKMLQFLWLDGVEQYHLMEHFHLASGFPEFIVFSPTKNVYIPFVGSYEEKALNEFLEGVIKGSKKPGPIRPLPELVSPSNAPSSQKEDL